MDKPPAGTKAPGALPGKNAVSRPPKKAEEAQSRSASHDESLASTLPQTEGGMEQPNEDDAAAFLLDQEDNQEPEETSVQEKAVAVRKKPAAEAEPPTEKAAPASASAPESNHLEATQAFAESGTTDQGEDAAEAEPDQGQTQQFTEEEAAAAAKPRPAPAKSSAQASQQKATVLGDYRLLKKLGQGGMGSVYLAHQMKLDRQVAIKVLSKELASKPAFVQRFLREARVMAKLDHPNILRCFDVGEALGYHYLAMEFVEGGSVEGWLKKQGNFSVADSLHIILACAHALQHAHVLGMIHRDIKPDNLLLTKHGVVKVADLGLAKATDDDMSLTRTGTGAGTPLYMAPEQARDVKHVDGRVDIYAMGCMLYVFLTGEFPFKGETLVEVIAAKDKGKFTPVRQLNDEVPDKLGLIIDKMLAAKPEHRYQSCAEIILALESLGLASKHLSFLEPPEGHAPKVETPPTPAKKISYSMRSSTVAGTEVGAGVAATPQADDQGDIWYVQLKGDGGKVIVKKVRLEQLLTMAKSKSIDADTQVSRARKEGYRALASFKEFQHLVKASATKDKAERKAEKFKALYKKIEKEEISRQRWRWINNLYLRAGGGVIFLLYLIIIVAVIAGLGYAFMQYGWPAIAEYFRRVTAS